MRVFTKQGFIDNQNRQFQQLVGLLTALLGLAVVIALFGIVNTLALSVIERTREIGLLRALGLSRGQLRATVRSESVVVALLGTVLGIVLGPIFAWRVVDALRSDGVSQYAVAVGELVVFVVPAALAGVVAAVLSARAAARVDLLAAIATEERRRPGRAPSAGEVGGKVRGQAVTPELGGRPGWFGRQRSARCTTPRR